ncbi:MAG: beta-ketoacyl-[acyl-carrier-protein] synthase family protein [Candidatus Omnitrophica bacterium]|nr:beta-ketoacyl-[acyl-carrier-protein] synthase family protein [Candidatus Omnitrophota bacterium]
MKKRVVVTGLGVISSLGKGKKEFWSNLINGCSGISYIECFDTSGHETHVGGEIKDFNPDDFMNKKRSRFMGRASQLAVAASKLAVADAGLNKNSFSQKKAGVCVGTTMGEIQVVEKIDHGWIEFGDNFIEKSPVFRSPVYNISANIAIELELKSKNIMFTTACSSGNYAIGYCFELIQSGDMEIALAGGSDAFSWIAFTGFNKVGVTAPDTCQPFDKNRKGMIPGEGAGILVLETLESARKRKANIYAEILGHGLSCDAYHMTNPVIAGVEQCMRNALNRANIKPQEVDYISAHGTGTVINDRTESAAIKNIFQDQKVAVNSIKSMLGHAMGAASAMEAINCCMSIQTGIIAPTINFKTPDPECDIDCVPNKARKQKVNVILNNGFAFGGNNAALVLKKINQKGG